MTGTLARIKRRVLVTPDGHWLWTASVDSKGYGRVSVGGRVKRAHVAAWEAARGPVPPDVVLDHKCRIRHCCNPDCLEPVTHRENTLRGRSLAAERARRTHCPRGHELAGDNVYARPDRPNTRECRACKAARRTV